MVQKEKSINWVKVIMWIGGVELVGILGGLLTVSSIPQWYALLIKPWFSPPNWLFGPVWTILYAMIGFVGYRLWNTESKKVDLEKKLFLLQLGLNAVWTPVFFGLRNPGLALLVIGSLWLVLVWLIGSLWRNNWSLCWWLVPYLGWVSFASVLNLAIVVLN